MHATEIPDDLVECRTCKQGVLSVYKFCGSCGQATFNLDLDRERLKEYCGRCGSPLRGLKKYCSQCGEASALTRESQEQSSLLKLLQNPRFQMALIGVACGLLALPVFTPVRYDLTSSAPFVRVYMEQARKTQQRLELQVSRRDWSIRPVDMGEAAIADASGVAVDGLGNFFVSDASQNAIFRIPPEGAAKLYAGGGEAGFAGDEGPAAAAKFNAPRGIVLDDSGYLYVADSGNNRIRMIDPEGRVHTVAGCGDCDISKSSSTARQVRLQNPAALAFFGNNLLVGEAPAGAAAKRPAQVWSMRPGM